MAGIAPKYYYLTLGLIAFITLVGFIIAYRLQRQVAEEREPVTDKDLYGPLERAYYSGLMNEAEFHRIQQSMHKQKGTLDQLPPAPPPRKKKVFPVDDLAEEI